MKKVFISFDYDHDIDLKNLLVGQAKNTDSPFEIIDMSIKEVISSDWRSAARIRVRKCDIVIVICGEHTDTASGVSAELKIAIEEEKAYFLLKGRANAICVKPALQVSDKIYLWTWDNLKILINGKR